MNLRPERLADADREAKAITIFSRPRGYFDAERDKMNFDGQALLPGVPPTGAGVSSSTVKVTPAVDRAIKAEFNGERVVGRTWSAANGHVVILELTY